MAGRSADESSAATQGMEAFGQAVKSLLASILHDAGIEVHSIEYELTDLLGVRIITCSAEEVDVAAAALRPHVRVVERDQLHGRALLDPDPSGFLSLHQVAELEDELIERPEYSAFARMQFELQVRSILQHAWAEIEQDLGYEEPQALPPDMRHRLSRLAGLLQLADEEFHRLRRDREQQDAAVRSTVGDEPEAFELNQSTLRVFLEHDARSRTLDHQIAARIPAQLYAEFNEGFAGRMAEWLSDLGIESSDRLRQLFDEFYEYLEVFSRHWLDEAMRLEVPPDFLTRGVSLYYFGHFLLGSMEPERRVAFMRARTPGSDDSRLLEQAIDVWAATVQELGPLTQTREKLLEELRPAGSR